MKKTRRVHPASNYIAELNTLQGTTYYAGAMGTFPHRSTALTEMADMKRDLLLTIMNRPDASRSSAWEHFSTLTRLMAKFEYRSRKLVTEARNDSDLQATNIYMLSYN
ncbi:hypothetical protein EVAR_80797_1 [Eumeta japonica]|uniref:Uncharacterized protein n=1 Tax=Eumeta variegata TaxID=151549 RepID=A0A4C1WFF8_EUMVA|nr:hypothetical protein EVAR_80797_1 [Eumeta japonica]